MLKRNAFLVVLLFLGSTPVFAAQGFVPLVEGGFGDCQNTFAWSMAWFNGRLCVGTGRGSVIEGGNDPEMCPIDDDAAEIWCYTPETSLWDLAYKSPRDVAVPSGLAARDNGYRDMIVFRESDGSDALYVAGVLFPFEGDPRRPRILRSTDAVSFEPVPQAPGTFLGELEAESFRAMAVYHGKLFVTAGTSLGEGVLLESPDPAQGNDSFRQVSPPGLTLFELEVFEDRLYVGTGEPAGTGFSVLKTEATGEPPYSFAPLVEDGGGPDCRPLRGLLTLCPNNTVLSMEVFEGRLYVGGQTDVIRVLPDDSWELVVGDPRTTPGGLLEPLSGKRSGFGSFFTGHVWRLAEHEGFLYAATWDFGTLLRNVPLVGGVAQRRAGFDLWRSRDGIRWLPVTRDGFGNAFDHAVRSLVSTPAGLFLGTVNPWEGAGIWRTP